jgi:hypothetical protein
MENLILNRINVWDSYPLEPRLKLRLQQRMHAVHLLEHLRFNFNIVV